MWRFFSWLGGDFHSLVTSLDWQRLFLALPGLELFLGSFLGLTANFRVRRVDDLLTRCINFFLIDNYFIWQRLAQRKLFPA